MGLILHCAWCKRANALTLLSTTRRKFGGAKGTTKELCRHGPEFDAVDAHAGNRRPSRAHREAFAVRAPDRFHPPVTGPPRRASMIAMARTLHRRVTSPALAIEGNPMLTILIY